MTIEEVSFRDFTRGHVPSDVLLLEDKEVKLSHKSFVIGGLS